MISTLHTFRCPIMIIYDTFVQLDWFLDGKVKKCGRPSTASIIQCARTYERTALYEQKQTFLDPFIHSEDFRMSMEDGGRSSCSSK